VRMGVQGPIEAALAVTMTLRRWHGSPAPSPWRGRRAQSRLLGGPSDTPRSENPEARSPVCYEVLDVNDESMVLCDPGSLPVRKGEDFCWTFNSAAVCAFHETVPQRFTELRGLYTCACPAFTTCTDPAGTFKPTPGWNNFQETLTIGRCDAASGALFGITLFFGIMIAAGCVCFCRYTKRQGAKINAIPGLPGASETAFAIGSR